MLVAATITYNVVEAVVALTEGTRVSSSALIGFGLDSVIEVSSAAAVAWQFSAKDPETREKAALRFIAFSFFALAAYVTVDAVLSLARRRRGAAVAVGIVLAAASLAIMPVLSLAQRRAGRELGSLSAVADSKQTLLCTYLSAILLAGLVLNSAARLVVGRPRRRARHRRDRGARRRQRLAGRPVLLMKGTDRCPSSRSCSSPSSPRSDSVGAVGNSGVAPDRRVSAASAAASGSAEWFAGVGFVVAMAGGGRRAGPAAARRGVAGGLPARAVDPDHRHRDRGGRHRRHRLRPARHGRLVADRRRPRARRRRWSAPACSDGCATRSSPR